MLGEALYIRVIMVDVNTEAQEELALFAHSMTFYFVSRRTILLSFQWMLILICITSFLRFIIFDN